MGTGKGLLNSLIAEGYTIKNKVCYGHFGV